MVVVVVAVPVNVNVIVISSQQKWPFEPVLLIAVGELYICLLGAFVSSQ